MSRLCCCVLRPLDGIVSGFSVISYFPNSKSWWVRYGFPLYNKLKLNLWWLEGHKQINPKIWPFEKRLQVAHVHIPLSWEFKIGLLANEWQSLATNKKDTFTWLAISESICHGRYLHYYLRSQWTKIRKRHPPLNLFTIIWTKCFNTICHL
jgi:hypothetical protein